MGGQSRAYREWREERNIQPWVEARPKKDSHSAIRSEVRGKKKRLKIAGNYSFLFDNRDVAAMFKSTVDYYSNVGLVMRNVESGEYKRMAICSRWNLKKDSWYKKRYWDIYESVKDEKKVTMLAIGYDQRRMYDVIEESGWKGDFYGYLMGRIGDDIRTFLKRLRSFYKRKGYAWNYRGYAVEPYEESGLPHIHFYFKGVDSRHRRHPSLLGLVAAAGHKDNGENGGPGGGVPVELSEKGNYLYQGKSGSSALRLCIFLGRSSLPGSLRQEKSHG